MRVNQLPLLQQPPFRYVHFLEDWTTEGGTTGYIVESQAFFVSEEKLQLAGLMEHMAQSCAALIGQLDVDKGKDVHIMPLCAIKNLVVNMLPNVGNLLKTMIEICDLDFGIYSMFVKVYIDDKLIASAEVKVGE